MGLFKKVSSSLGHADKHLLKTGTLAAGLVMKCEPTGMGLGNTTSAYGGEAVCNVTVEIHGLPGHPPYRASCKHAIPQVYLPQMQMQGATVAVRVDPDDPQNIELDLTATPPPITDLVAAASDSYDAILNDPNAGSVTIQSPEGPVELPTHTAGIKAADIIVAGVPCRATLLMSTPLGQKNDAGLDVMGLIFTIVAGNGETYQAQIGMPVPANAMPLLYPSADLPARALPDWFANPAPLDMVTIDFAAALAEKAAKA